MSMLEPFDAQMLDYPSDLDVPMHSSSSDSWFHAEAPMDDAATPLNALTHRQTLPESSLSVEVDMDAYDDVLEQTSAEYEMADDIQDTSADLLDVEVYDASVAPSPLPQPDDNSYAPQKTNEGTYEGLVDRSTLSFAQSTIATPIDNPLTHSDTSSNHHPPLSSFDIASSDEKLGNNDEDLCHDQSPAQATEVNKQILSSSTHNSEFINESSDGTHTLAIEGNEVTSGVETEQFNVDDGGQFASQACSSTGNPLEPISTALLAEQNSSEQNNVANGQNLMSPATAQGSDQATYADETSSFEHVNAVGEEKTEEYVVDDENKEEAEDVIANVPEYEGASTDVDDREVTDAVENVQAAVSDDSTSSGDPHEISEGVYIDPPPPVLLSISGQVEVSLFNEISTSNSSRSRTESESHFQTAHVLLQNFPTLYYEPISSVFEALRQDDYITNISEYVDSELVLDAYDLQLVVSEDNIFAREVSLHDLNTLHDASGISGPLRLRMQTIAPRFIVRFHMLQENISLLHETNDEEDSSSTSGKNTHTLPPSHVEEVQQNSCAEDVARDARRSAEPADPENAVDDEEANILEQDEPEGGTRCDGTNEDDSERALGEKPSETSDTANTPKHLSTDADQDESPDDYLSVIKEGEIGNTSESLSAYDESEDPEGLYLEGTVGDTNPLSEANNYEEEDWNDDDAEGDIENVSGTENEVDAISNESSVTLSSKASKRSFDEADLEHDDTTGAMAMPSSPGKRPRVE